MKRLLKSKAHLKTMILAKPKALKSLVRLAPIRVLLAISDCATNILCGNVAISASQLKTLGPHKKALRFIQKASVESIRGHLLSDLATPKVFRALVEPVLAITL